MKDFKDQLITWTKKNDSQDTHEKKGLSAKQSIPEALSEQEIKELMGMDRPRYRRGRGGALRQK